MENTIVKKELGPEAMLTVEFVEGSLKLSVEYKGKLGGADLGVTVDAVQLIDAITDAIPGEMDDAIIDGLAQKLLAKKTG